MTAPLPPSTGRLRRSLTAGLLLAGALAALLFVYLRRDEVGEALSRLSVPAALGSLAAGLGAGVATMLGWRVVIADMGAHLPLGAAARVYFLGQLGKYLPGSVWSVLAQMELGRDYGVRRPASAAAATLMLVLAAVTGTAIAVVLLPTTEGSLLADYGWVALAALPLLGLLVPAVQQRLVAIAARVLRRPMTLPRSTAAGTLRAAAWLLVGWTLLGLHLHLLVASTCGCEDASLPLGIGVFALAWVAGFLIILAPAGAGIREAVLVLGLAPVLDPGTALLIALISRVLLTASDFGLAGFGILLARRYPRRLPEPGEVGPDESTPS